MCGIFGFCYSSGSGIKPRDARRMMDHLFNYSQRRGKEASGIFLDNSSEQFLIKETAAGSRFIKRADYARLFDKDRLAGDKRILMLGHARLDTQGSKWDNNNNSPLDYLGVYGIHNGIVVNAEDLWKQHADLKRYRQVDSEVILAMFWQKLQAGLPEQAALVEILGSIEGSASVALFSTTRQTLSLATNTGSLYFIEYGNGLFVFASECYILEQFHHRLAFLKKVGRACMKQVLPGSSVVIDINKAALSLPYQGRIAHALL